MSSGIYAIRNLANSKVYIGSSIHIHRRWRAHRSLLMRGVHHTRHLQGAWDKYGESAFAFEIVEIVPASDLLGREQFWVDHFRCADPAHGYNIAVCVAAPMLGRKLSPEACAKVSAAKKGIKKAPFTEEHKRNMARANRRGRPGRRALTPPQIECIRGRIMAGETAAALAREYSVSHATITKVKNNGYRAFHVLD